MDVGIVTTADRLGGLVRYCTNLADALHRAGHSVTLYAPAPIGEGRGYAFVRTSPNAWRAALEVRRLAGRHDLLHFQPVDAAPIALLAGRPYVVTVNGDDLLTHDRVDRFLKRLALDRARLVIPNSRFTARLLAKEFPEVDAPLDVAAPLVLPPGDPDYSVADGIGDEPFVLSVGGLVPRKGFDALIRAASRVGIRVVVVGRGPDATRLRNVAKEAGADLRLLEDVGDAALEGLYRRATFFALLSRDVTVGETVEGFGMVLVEAMRRTVAISTTHGGMPEVTPPSLHVEDEESAARLMRRLLDDSAGYARAKAECAERAERLFDPAALLARYERAYERAMGARQDGSGASGRPRK